MSPALAAHGLHYGLVGGGLVLVVALLRGGRTRRNRGAAEHDRRVAELREAARSGRLGERRVDDDRP
ncbi:MAG TPA: hypothetical protein VEV65_08870 [Kineosporiaceae bacterium]|nr:hypothetical protein [Kineosporiaceae bacterium]